jgi:hypothetical protein
MNSVSGGGTASLPFRSRLIPHLNDALAWISTSRESPNAGVGYLIHLTQEFGSECY